MIILLATYNSSKFIEKLFDSLFSQTCQDWSLLIRDDCSTDNTIEIVLRYQEIYPARIKILANEGVSLGAYLNFVELLTYACSDYYMFCDHDDIWLPNKVQISYERMKQLEVDNPDKAIIVHTDMKVVDHNLNIIFDSFWEYSNLLPNHTKFEEIVLCNSANGCTMLFNNHAREVALKNIDNATMHDILLNQSVAGNGGIISAIKLPTVLYRQHCDNVVGAHKRNFLFYLKKGANLPSLFSNNIATWSRANRIRKLSIVKFFWTKIKIFYYRIKEKYPHYE